MVTSMAPMTNVNDTETENANSAHNISGDTRYRIPRRDTRSTVNITLVSKDFKGATPEIGELLGFRNKNISKNLNFDTFCSKLEICLMKELRNGRTRVHCHEIRIC